MMRLSQQYETEADMLALQTTEDPEEFSNMLETFKREIKNKLSELEEEHQYVTEHLKIIEQTSPDRFASISSDAQNHYQSTKDGLQNLINGNGSTHPSLDSRQKMAHEMMHTIA